MRTGTVFNPTILHSLPTTFARDDLISHWFQQDERESAAADHPSRLMLQTPQKRLSFEVRARLIRGFGLTDSIGTSSVPELNNAFNGYLAFSIDDRFLFHWRDCFT